MSTPERGAGVDAGVRVTLVPGADSGDARTPSAEPPPAPAALPRGAIEQSVPACFERQVERTAEHAAIRTEHGAITYRALNQMANRVAHTLLATCGAAPEPVALLFEHGAAAIVAVLGGLKAGKILVPLDASYPGSRISALLAHSQARTILTDAASRASAVGIAAGTLPVIDIDAIDEAVSAENPGLPISPDATERVMYTSGSTGHPKGVFRTHRVSLHSAVTYAHAVGIGPADRMLLLFSYSHSAGMFGILGAVLNGATVVPFDVRRRGLAAAAEVLARDGITIYYSTPTAFRALGESLRGAVRFPSLRLIELAGEPVSRSDVELYRALTSEDCLLLNHLGSSEAGFYRQYFVTHKTRIDDPLVPAGYAIPDKTVLLLDDAGRGVAPGEVGEIVVRSRYLTSGYWRDPDLTRQTFSLAPDDSGEQLYRSGDLGRLLPDGCLVYLGRKDAQVKIRGYRVEPAEVEAALREHPQVRDAAVVGRPHPRSGDTRLVAYVVPRGPAPSAGDLREAVRRLLPEYMVPSVVVFLDALPLLPGGKVDRLALPEPSWEHGARRETFVAPAETVEYQIVQIWEDVLGVRPIGVRDNFFDLGGDSLRAARMMDRLERECGHRLPMTSLLENPTIEDLAAVLLRETRATPRRPIKVQAGGARRPFFYLHGDFGGGGFYCIPFARALGEDQPFYALAPHGTDGQAVPGTIEAMAASYIPVLRAIQPHGPYLLGGHCNGGIVAFEMARQLRVMGETVDLLALIAASGQNSRYRHLYRVASGVGALLCLSPEQRGDLFRRWRVRLSRVARLRRSGRTRLRRLWKLATGDPAGVALHRLYRPRRRSPRLLGRGAAASGGTAPLRWLQDPTRGRDYSGDELWAIYGTVLRRYVPRWYPGRVTVFWPVEQRPLRPRDPTRGWGRVAARVDVVTIPGGHLTCVTTHVEALAERLKPYLELAQSGR